jgi:alpha-maltose-1-phosphate synthase
VIAVSFGMRRDLLDAYPNVDPGRVHVVYNGVDAEEYAPDRGTDALERHGIDPARPSVVFVGRITRQKGVPHLLRAALRIDPEAQLVLCAGAPDTPEIAAEVTELMETVRARRGNMLWLQEMLPKHEVIQLLSHATVFVCPSIYEPLGIVNLEAMACEAAVVASAVGETGILVPFDAVDDPTQEPADPERFAADFAAAVNALLADPARAEAMGLEGRRRAVERFSWPAIARETVRVYESALAGEAAPAAES